MYLLTPFTFSANPIRLPQNPLATISLLSMSMFLFVLFVQLQPRCPSIDECINGVYTYIYIWQNISHKKEWNLAICDHTDGPRGYHARWNKSDKEFRVLLQITSDHSLVQLSVTLLVLTFPFLNKTFLICLLVKQKT